MMDVLRLIAMVLLAVLFVILAYALTGSTSEVDKLKKLLEEEREKLQSERENRQRAEKKLSETNGLIEQLKAQNNTLEARLTRLWEETARLRKPAGAGPKRSHGDF
jgi:peptidoglycan hydrolase CwlO-like protein